MANLSPAPSIGLSRNSDPSSQTSTHSLRNSAGSSVWTTMAPRSLPIPSKKNKLRKKNGSSVHLQASQLEIFNMAHAAARNMPFDPNDEHTHAISVSRARRIRGKIRSYLYDGLNVRKFRILRGSLCYRDVMKKHGEEMYLLRQSLETTFPELQVAEDSWAADAFIIDVFQSDRKYRKAKPDWVHPKSRIKATDQTACGEKNQVENLALTTVAPLSPMVVPGDGEISNNINSLDAQSTEHENDISATETTSNGIRQTHTNIRLSLPISSNQNADTNHHFNKFNTVLHSEGERDSGVTPLGRRTSGNFTYNPCSTNVNQNPARSQAMRDSVNHNGSKVASPHNRGAKRSYPELRATSTRANQRVLNELYGTVPMTDLDTTQGESQQIEIAEAHQRATSPIDDEGDDDEEGFADMISIVDGSPEKLEKMIRLLQKRRRRC